MIQGGKPAQVQVQLGVVSHRNKIACPNARCLLYMQWAGHLESGLNWLRRHPEPRYPMGKSVHFRSMCLQVLCRKKPLTHKVNTSLGDEDAMKCCLTSIGNSTMATSRMSSTNFASSNLNQAEGQHTQTVTKTQAWSVLHRQTDIRASHLCQDQFIQQKSNKNWLSWMDELIRQLPRHWLQDVSSFAGHN